MYVFYPDVPQCSEQNWSLHQKRINHIEKLSSAGIRKTLLANCGALQRDGAVSRDVSIQTSGVAGKVVHPL